MSIRRITLGSGFRYLMSSVARMDQAGPATGLAAYYAAEGTPQGQFLGAGLAGLDGGRGVSAGSVVSEEALWRMLGMLQDPASGEALGRRPPATRSASIDRVGRLRPAPKTVAGFDLTFSAPKSVSVAWALADQVTRARIHAAHRRALGFVIEYAEREVIETRVGAGGAVCDPVRGVVSAAFDHWDSRAGDPQLHTHLVVLNRVQSAVDGQWRTLDSKGLFRAAVMLSELYNGVLADELTLELGWGWEPETRARSAEVKWEVAGVSKDLRAHFSSRSSAIEAAKDALVEEYVAAHGQPPSLPQVLRMRQQATLATRPGKQHQSLRDLVTGWRRRAEPFVGTAQQAWVASLGEPGPVRPRLHTPSELSAEELDTMAADVLGKVADKRSTFTRANILAESFRLLHGIRFAAVHDRTTVAERVATRALARAVMLTPQETGIVPDGYARADGTTRFRPRNSELYSTQALLDAEQRLLDAGQSTGGPVAAVPSPTDAVDAGQGREEPALTPEQRAAVAAVLSSGRMLDVLVGAAGVGKSTAMAAVRAAWEATHGAGSVVGLAPSAAAADVLADAVGVATENTAKWILENRRSPERQVRLEAYAGALSRAHPSRDTRRLREAADALAEEYWRWAVLENQLVIIDEASMAATADLDHITQAVVAAAGKVLLVGDWAQLSPVGAGAAFHLLANDRTDPPTIRGVHRFRHEWERDASLALREGSPDAADAYFDRGRVVAGDCEDLLDALFDAWRHDTKAGRTSLMLAADTQTVADLNRRARAHRVATGEVSAGGVTLGDGTVVGVGDWVVTRLNARTFTGARGWVKNGDAWVIRAVRPDGALDVVAPAGGGDVLLPRHTSTTRSSSATPPQPTGPKDAPSTPPTPTSRSAPSASPSTSWPLGAADRTSCTSTPQASHITRTTTMTRLDSIPARYYSSPWPMSKQIGPPLRRANKSARPPTRHTDSPHKQPSCLAAVGLLRRSVAKASLWTDDGRPVGRHSDPLCRRRLKTVH